MELNIPGSKMLPSFRLKLESIFSIQILSSLHHIHMIGDDLASLDEDWRLAIGTTSNRKSSIANSTSRISRNDRMKSKD